MNILGVFNGKNASVALVRDGKIVYAALEERFNRIKLSRGYPFQSIENCLKENHLKKEDINIVACGAWDYPHLDAVKDYFLTSQEIGLDIASERMYHSLKADEHFRREFFIQSRELFPNAEIKTYNHHFAHAVTAFYPSPFDESFVITADGRGDSQSTVVWTAKRKDGLKRVKTFCELKSLGALYGQITGFLGFTPDRHEGKITGLAAFGKPTALVDRLLELIHFENGNFCVSPNHTPFMKHEYTYLKKIAEGYTKEDVAYAVQFVLEKNISDLIDWYLPEGSNLALAGGIFANVKLNQRIREHRKVKNCYVFPEMGDGGIGFGGALAAAVEAGYKTFDLENLYLGPAYNWDNVELANYVVHSFSNKSTLVEKAVNLLVENKILGIFTGRMEFGPRALGSRSIIMSAANKEINDFVNKRLNRTEFMPFAPVTLSEHGKLMYKDFFENDLNLKFMTTCYDCTDEMKRTSPAVVHVDGTARPQIISENYGQDLYYQILKKYFEKTGIPSLVNTSFNNHEEPIVCSPEDALRSLALNNIDYIVTDDKIISAK